MYILFYFWVKFVYNIEFSLFNSSTYNFFGEEVQLKLIFERNAMITIFSQYFYNKSYVAGCYGLLLVGQKSNFNERFKLEPITTNRL